MSEALLEQAAAGRHEAQSAGTTPAEHVHPQVVEVMGEKGIDLAHRKSKKLSQEANEWADVVMTMGCGDECPYIPGSATSTGTRVIRRIVTLTRFEGSAVRSRGGSRDSCENSMQR
jgi:protein-tyrosine-phosphatase